MKISGNIVDIVDSKIFPGTVVVSDGKITEIIEDSAEYSNYIIPGFVDAHIHIESSMLIPSEFARLAVVHGTVATVSDPHEIVNVLGVPGLDFMLENAAKVPFKFYFGASSCVPATSFETSGARLEADSIEKLLERKEIKYLSEMMNYPGVINRVPEVMAKLDVAKKLKVPIDGHAPGLIGEGLKKYVSAGIQTDHETYFYEEGLQKLDLGLKLIIREGSAAKNFNALHPFIGTFPNQCMFCSDDKHPDDLVKGHINQMAARAVKLGYDKMDVLRIAILHPIKHYGLEVGLLQKGDPADMVVVDNLENFNALKTYIDGKLVMENGKSLLTNMKVDTINNFNSGEKKVEDFVVKKAGKIINIIEAIDGQLITRRLNLPAKFSGDNAVSDTDNDILKLTVVNRYKNVPPAVAFVRNFGLKNGAIASSFAHDSHNVVAVGTSDEYITRAANMIIRNRGGLSLAIDREEELLSLPIAGLMTDADGYGVAEKYSKMTKIVRGNGSKLRAPFMTLAFMALLVIPEIKLSDRGLFDGKIFNFISLFEK
ncbi:MAG: adenine deaminase [Candidatus Eremiobacteraeota bacterium]|nr:adenine deaminase [Candidatus Eremiobacteraeota bacterium]